MPVELWGQPLHPTTATSAMTRSRSKLQCLSLLLSAILAACAADRPPSVKISRDSLWNQPALADFLDYARSQHTSGLVILQKGKPLVEAHWPVPPWQHPMYALSRGQPTPEGIAREDVASLQKSLVSLLVEHAVSEALVNLDESVSTYLGSGWSVAPIEQESRITVRHLLSMTSGLDDTLKFVAPPGRVWHYNTAAYAQLIRLLENVTNRNIAELSRAWIFEPAGMIDSDWQTRHWIFRAMSRSTAGQGLYSTAPDLARLGHWMLGRLPVDKLLREMLTPSQTINPAYGHLWWLNGYPLRATNAQASSTQVLIPSAPGDLIAGQGFLDRRLDIVPSLNLIVARIGSKAEADFELKFWQLLMQALPEASEQCSHCDGTVADSVSNAIAEGLYISWREHIIDDPGLGPGDLAGSDGLQLHDLDEDGYLDILSVHESDTEYDGQARGYVRIAWGSSSAAHWELETLAEGPEVAAAEDLALADFDGDGDIDIVVASELAPLLYIENPGSGRNASDWPRSAIETKHGRGSFIRVAAADLDGDGRPELIAANKGSQNPNPETTQNQNPILLFQLPEHPLQTGHWREQVVGKLRIPINARAVDMDDDGDLDILAGSRGERRILWYENQGSLNFVERPISIQMLPDDILPTGFKLDYVDIDNSGKKNILLVAWPGIILKLSAQDETLSNWRWQKIADLLPDRLVSIGLGDIDNDGDLDIFSGSYSDTPRSFDDPLRGVHGRAGQVAWFENPGDSESAWKPHLILRRKRGMYDAWVIQDLDQDGDLDALGTRGNSYPFDGVFWLEQMRSTRPTPPFTPSRSIDSQHLERVAPEVDAK